MVDENRSRTYRLGRRAEGVEETRQRIVEAVVHLHETDGPAQTTIAAIAELAGVQRNTVYRHFPAEEELFAACSVYYWQRHPWPDPTLRTSGDSTRAQVTEVLGQIYAFYADVEPMLTNVLRDTHAVPQMERAGLANFAEFLDAMTKALITACAPTPDQKNAVTAAIRHALGFSTWQSLVRQNGLSPSAAIELLWAMIDAAPRRSS